MRPTNEADKTPPPASLVRGSALAESSLPLAGEVVTGAVKYLRRHSVVLVPLTCRKTKQLFDATKPLLIRGMKFGCAELRTAAGGGGVLSDVFVWSDLCTPPRAENRKNF